MIPGVERFGKFVLTEQVWNYLSDDAEFDTAAFAGERPASGLTLKEVKLHTCSLDKDWPNFYPPD